MYEVTSRTTAPYASICYITCTWADGSATRASGVVVGRNDVLTANHVVYDPQLGYAVTINVTPAADTRPYSAPFGSFTSVGVVATRNADGNWDRDFDGLVAPSEAQNDMALIGLRAPIGDTTGWLATAPDSADFYGTMVGYPGRGTGMMEEAVYADASASWGVFNIASGLGAGASGGPLLHATAAGPTVVGVLSSGNSSNTTSTYAGLFGSGSWQWLTAAMAANDGVIGTTGQGYALNTSFPPATMFTGGAGADTLTGSAADDSFTGGGGDDILNGMGGTDTALYAGARNDYILARSGGGITVQHRSGTDGRDTLLNMERVAFADKTVNLEIGARAQSIAPAQLKALEELYVAFFNRVPEADGLAYWIGQTAAGRPLADSADAFYGAALLYPAQTGYSASMGSAAFVDLVYRNVLGRTAGADAEGLAYWTNALDSGAAGRGSLVTNILNTAHTFKGNATWGWVADLLDNKAAVAHKVAVEMGLGGVTPQASISQGMAIAAAVTPTDTAAAIALIGVTDGFSTLG